MIGRRVLLPLFALCLLGAFVTVALPSGRAALGAGADWLRGAGAAGHALALGLVVVGITLGLPTMWFAALLGYLYGIGPGLALAVPATLLGSTVAFGLARWLLAGELERLVAGRPRWRAVASAVGGGGARLVALLRLAGPHNALNVALAASSLPTRAFVAGTVIGAFPTVALATVGGALAPEVGALWELRDTLGPAWWAVIALGAAALVAAAVVVRRAARDALARAALEGERR